MTLQRFIWTLITLIITLAILGYLFAQIVARGSQTNYFNQKIRPTIVSSPFLRSVFFFRDYGDGRYDYLKSGAKIRFNIFTMEELGVSNELLDELVAKTRQVTSREVSYRTVTLHIPYQAIISKDEQDAIIKKYDQARGDYSDVYVFILSQDHENPELIGTTANQNSMVIFADAIKIFTDDDRQTTPNYILSTILHELGHLLGLEHTSEEGCLMLEHAESDHLPKRDPDDVVVDFCSSEIRQIKEMQKR